MEGFFEKQRFETNLGRSRSEIVSESKDRMYGLTVKILRSAGSSLVTILQLKKGFHEEQLLARTGKFVRTSMEETPQTVELYRHFEKINADLRRWAVELSSTVEVQTADHTHGLCSAAQVGVAQDSETSAVTGKEGFVPQVYVCPGLRKQRDRSTGRGLPVAKISPQA